MEEFVSEIKSIVPMVERLSKIKYVIFRSRF